MIATDTISALPKNRAWLMDPPAVVTLSCAPRLARPD